MTVTNFDELKRLRAEALSRGYGSKAWLDCAAVMMDSFPALYDKPRGSDLRRERTLGPCIYQCNYLKEYGHEIPISSAASRRLWSQYYTYRNKVRARYLRYQWRTPVYSPNMACGAMG